KVSATEVEIERTKGQVKAENIEKEMLAHGAHEMRMRQSMLSALPNIIQQASAPIEKIREIRAISLSGTGITEGQTANNVGSLLASASTIPVVREMFRFLSDLEQNVGSDEQRGRAAHS